MLFWGALWPTTSCLALLRPSQVKNTNCCFSFMDFDQRLVVWRYYDSSGNKSSVFQPWPFSFDQRLVVWRYYDSEIFGVFILSVDEDILWPTTSCLDNRYTPSKVLLLILEDNQSSFDQRLVVWLIYWCLVDVTCVLSWIYWCLCVLKINGAGARPPQGHIRNQKNFHHPKKQYLFDTSTSKALSLYFQYLLST